MAIIREYANLIGESIFGENYRIEKDSIVVLNSENYEECKNKLLSELQKGQRKFILSTYQTVGAGQNLQFPIPETADPIQINSFPARPDMDIDGIYLDRPTNLIVNIYNDTFKDNEFIKYLFQLEFLVENGAISPKAFKSKLDEAFHRYVGRIKPKRKLEDFTSLYNTDAYTRYLNKVIIQAVGRICRSNMKAPTIHILADASIKKHLAGFDLPDDVIPVR
ncbi:hypothetical protein METHB2_780023 [Candidatus Methylobacter favarea]|uniref:Uncharacterized protein n=1 Tax=Candidatus Methylobacter favarea TaxID=2707345 RepID=A0A8S0WCP2_9GAMM|nr:hypothetical protein [Candidatus Methylobacter favarea]CAA9892665.1 hypothetical protein METHB2_780023 [Candidatus Methylobacter favarea]